MSSSRLKGALVHWGPWAGAATLVAVLFGVLCGTPDGSVPKAVVPGGSDDLLTDPARSDGALGGEGGWAEDAASGDGLALVAILREAGDVEGLLEQARGARGRAEPRLRRQAMVALASLAAIPTPAAEVALEGVVRDVRASSLERTTALAALWQRGARDFVRDVGDRSDDPALRSKARVLNRAAGW